MPGSPNKRRRNDKRFRAEERIANLPAVIPPPPEPKDRWGRPTKFKPEYVEQVRILCEEGFIDPEIGEFFGVSRQTLHEWKRGHPDFGEAMKLGKHLADERVKRSLYERAIGYTVTVTKHIRLKNPDGSERVEKVEEEIFIPPDTHAQKFFLINRRGDEWSDKSEKHITGGAEFIHLTTEQAKERLAAKLLELRNRQEESDGE